MSDMNTAYKVAALAVRQRFAEQHPNDLEILDSIIPADVAVYSGAYDKVEDILRCLDVPFEMNPGAKSKTQIIFHNAPIVAVSFDWGKGHVFHVISHFWCKRDQLRWCRRQSRSNTTTQRPLY